MINPLLISYYKHRGMQEALDSSRKHLIELLILNKEDIRSHKSNYTRISAGEFRLNDCLYDIVQEIDKGSLLYIYCVNDKKEEQLEKKLLKMEEQSRKKTQEPSDNTNFDPLLSEAVGCATPGLTDPRCSGFANYEKMICIQEWGDIPTPPPRSASSL
jgi:hypothetical protein